MIAEGKKKDVDGFHAYVSSHSFVYATEPLYLTSL